MISRRHFLGVSSLAAAGVATSCELPENSSGGGGAGRPPSIAALPSRAQEAIPISAEERMGRIEKARRLMVAGGMDALMLTGGTSLVYFTNIQWGLSERLFSVVIPVNGRAFLVCPAFEEDRAREQLQGGPLEDTEVLTWHEHESPYALVAGGLRARALGTGRLGIEETVRFAYSDGVAQEAPSLSLASGTPITVGCRGVKDQHELALMQLANEVTLTAYKAAYEALEAGMTQGDFRNLVSMAHSQQGFSGSAGVQVGQYSALPHGSVTPQVIEEGSILLIDGGCSAEGYRSDISRTFLLGEPTDKMRHVFEIAYRAQAAALAAAAPGVEAQSVDAAARSVIEEGGYGPEYTYFTHRVGHGIGMDGHEWPYLVKGNTLALEPGMTFSDEPGIYIPGEFGVRLEDDMYITED
ncbi:MAG: Xaa-Pro peptidase family protein, partial [Longimicrobiales bacterium]|nr:Xaa-Pro peptidase family protein [Longimicrobiales bacterium]